MKTSWRAHLRYLHRAVLERLGAFLTGVITTLVAGWVTGVLDQFVPSPERTRLAVENVWRGNPERSEEGFRIVLCWLENDAEGDNTLEVASAFQNPDLGGIKLVRSARIVVGSGAWDEWSEDMQQSVRAVLEDWDADLAIVGRVRRSGELLSLWVVPHSDEGTLGRGNRPYELDNVTLGEDFHADLRIQLAAVALAAVAPLADTEIRGRVLEKGLRDATEKLSTLLEGRAIGSAEHQAALHVALGNALQTLGDRESGTERLEQAVVTYRTALEEYTRERAPLDWAMTQNNLGNALQTLGGRESGTERLEQAVVAYRAALEEYTRERAPLQWAATQNNLGAALQTLGGRESDMERLEQAMVAYRAALEEYNLGAALQTLGDRESGTERLEQAVVAYRAALEEYKGADPNIPDRGGRTAVHGAASIGAIETIAALLKTGGNPNRRDEDGNTPLHVAAAASQPTVMVNQSIATIRVLLNARADPNTANAAGRTPLHAAVGPNLGWPGVVRVLLDGGANPRTADGDGLTVLQRFVHDAPDHGRTAAMLVEAGADPDRKYANGDAPLHAAIRRGGSRGKVEVAEALLAAGADPCIRDGRGFIPYSVAAEGGPIHRALGRAGGHDLACDKQEAVSLDLGQRRRIQEALASAGFDPGPADGEFGPRTRRAIQAWQQANGHAATGDPTRAQAETISSPTEGPPQAAAVREAQRLLAALGYKPGSADGLWGPRTASAYGAFLRDAGLPQGKVVGQETMRTMRKIAGKRKAP